MSTIDLSDRTVIAAFWKRELGWNDEQCEAEFASENWQYGHTAYWRDGDDHPSIHFFKRGDVIEISDGLESLRRFTPFADDPS